MHSHSTLSVPSPPLSSALGRTAVLVYGVVAYAIGIGGLLSLIAVSLGLLPLTGGPVAIGTTGGAIAFNLLFVALFGVQHAVMARPAFKERWTRIIPAAMERPTFVLLSGVIMGSAMWLWQPLPSTVWAVESAALANALRGVAALGWCYMLAASFAIDHFELFGLKQVWRNFVGSEAPRVPFVSRLMYRFDRHPLMSGILIGLWCTPSMTVGRLVLAAGFSAYIVIGVAMEERTLVALHGDGYREYRRKVGALVPLPGRRG